jgi:uncharacterized protein DUF6084
VSAQLEPMEPGASAPEPAFAVLDATGRRYAAAPALDFSVQVTEPSGRAVYAIGLSAQVMIEPARRTYGRAAREQLVELFGSAERWGTTTRSFLWHKADVLVPNFVGTTTFRIGVPCTYDQELVADKYFYALEDGEVPLAFNFNGTVYYRNDDGRLQMSLVPWSCSAEFRLRVRIWRDLIEHYFPDTAWIAVRNETMRALRREKARSGAPTLDATVAGLLRERP